MHDIRSPKQKQITKQKAADLQKAKSKHKHALAYSRC